MDRFWSKVDKRGADDCWEWKAIISHKGYGQFSYNSVSTGAHRVVWMLVKGEIPEGLFVCHKCDNPRCVNPSHLFLGTNRDNVDDKMAKGRLPAMAGGKNPNSKLTDEIVTEIRQKYFSGKYIQKNLSRQYGVVQTTISKIVRDKSWNYSSQT